MSVFDRSILVGKENHAFVNEEDYELVSPYQWILLSTKGKQYAITRDEKNRKTIYMHRVILGAGSGDVCDHIDGDGLNNRRINIRLCSQPQNMRNRVKPITNKSGFKGVCWHKTNKKWHAQIGAKGKKYHLGFYETAALAHAAYCEAAKRFHGDYWSAG